jgi:hypothetical protein
MGFSLVSTINFIHNFTIIVTTVTIIKTVKDENMKNYSTDIIVVVIVVVVIITTTNSCFVVGINCITRDKNFSSVCSSL